MKDTCLNPQVTRDTVGWICSEQKFTLCLHAKTFNATRLLSVIGGLFFHKLQAFH